MNKFTAALLVLILLGCGAKTLTAPVIEEPAEAFIAPEIIVDEPEPEIVAEPVEPAIIIPEEPIVSTDKFITVIATGYGASTADALESGNLEAVIAAAGVALENGDAYIHDFSKIINELAPRHAEFVSDIGYPRHYYRVSLPTQLAQSGMQIEIAAKVNYTKLSAEINSLNAAVYSFDDPATNANAVIDRIAADEAKKARLLQEFASIFGNISDTLSVEITALEYNELAAQDGKIPFRLSFTLQADPQKYQQRAQQMIDLVLNEMDGSFVESIPLVLEPATEYHFANYIIPDEMGKINETHYATVLKRNSKYVLEIYKIGEDYINFFNQAYRDALVIGDPTKTQLHMKLNTADNKLIYEDYVQPFMSYRESQRYRKPAQGTYPITYLLNQHKRTEYNTRTPVNTRDFSINGVILSKINRSIQPNSLDENNKFPEKLAATTPFINLSVWEERSIEAVELQYEGLLNISDVNRLKSATIDLQ